MISSVIGSPRVRVDLATQPYRGFADDHREAARPLQRNGKRAVGRLRYSGATPPLGTRPPRPPGCDLRSAWRFGGNRARGVQLENGHIALGTDDVDVTQPARPCTRTSLFYSVPRVDAPTDCLELEFSSSSHGAKPYD